MNKLIIFFLLTFPLFTIAQQPMKGKFCSQMDYVGFCITFLENDSVIYKSWGCMLQFTKVGTYEFHEDSLILNFEPKKKTPSIDLLESIYSINYIDDCNLDSIKINISVKELIDKSELPFATVILCKSKDCIESDILVDTIADFDGLVTLNLFKEKFENSLYLKAEYVGLKSKTIDISANKCSLINFELASAGEYDPSNFDRRSYKINKMNRNKIILDFEEYQKELTRVESK